MSHHLSDDIRSCTEDCQACATTCLSSAIGHCLEMGGRHTEPRHFKLMLDCPEICQTAANFMARV